MQGNRLRRLKAAIRSRRCSVMGQHAVKEGQSASVVQATRSLGDEPLADHQVPEQTPFIGQADLGTVGELARAPDVVNDGGGQEQVAVKAGVQLAELKGECGHRHRVLEQAAQIGMVAGAAAGRAAQPGAELAVLEHALEQSAEGTVVNLSRQVLEKPIELVEV